MGTCPACPPLPSAPGQQAPVFPREVDFGWLSGGRRASFLRTRRGKREVVNIKCSDWATLPPLSPLRACAEVSSVGACFGFD